MMLKNRILTEKYRPKSLDEVVGNEQQVNVLKRFTEKDRLTHILLEGPAGVGKTASAQAFAQEVFGDGWESNFIDFNASDERGIDVIRYEIKEFARESPEMGYEYKIIFLDEADSLTKDAQSALRRTMEKFSDQTVFFLSCNYAYKLIDPIQSRCSVLSFNRLEDDEIKKILLNIIDGESLEYEEEAVDKIIQNSRGDARNAINNLSSSIEDGEILLENVQFISSKVDREEIREIVNLAVNGRVDEAIDKNTTDVIPSVTDYGSFCRELLYAIRSDENINTDVRWYLMSKVGNLENNIMQGATPEVQINSFITKIPVAQYSSIPNYE